MSSDVKELERFFIVVWITGAIKKTPMHSLEISNWYQGNLQLILSNPQ